MSTGKAGYTTYQVAVAFNPAMTRDVYALYGEAGDPLTIPAGFQVPTPFGSDVGPVNEAFFAMMPDAEFDSFVTIGTDGPYARTPRTARPGAHPWGWPQSAQPGSAVLDRHRLQLLVRDLGHQLRNWSRVLLGS